MSPNAGSSSQWKLTYLQSLLSTSECFIPYACITESWAEDFHTDAQFHIPSYTTHRSDRVGRSRGGVITYVHNGFTVSTSDRFCNQYCEVVSVQIESEKTCLINVYRPPKTPLIKFSETVSYIKQCVEATPDHWTKIVCGDLNFPNIDWDTSTIIPGLTKECNDSASLFLQFMGEAFLSQYVHTPTRKNNILDLFITNDCNIVHEIESTPSRISDHNVVSVTLSYSPGPSVNRELVKPYSHLEGFSRINLCNCDFDSVSSLLNEVDWENLHEMCPIEDFPELFRLIVLQCTLLYSTSHTNRHKKGVSKAEHGLSRKRRKLTARLNALLKHNPLSPEISKLRSRLGEIEIKIRDTIRSSQFQRETRALKVIKSNPKYFYSWVILLKFAQSHTQQCPCL